MNTTLNIEALRPGLSALASEALTLYRWALNKSVDPRQPTHRQLAARDLADRVAHAALSQCEWTATTGSASDAVDAGYASASRCASESQ